MDKQRKAKLKNILLKMREEIISKVKSIEKENLRETNRDSAGDLSGYSLHMADVASDSFERDMSLGLAAKERELLKQIDLALIRMKERTFGSCEKCSKDIGIKRLSAVPYARLCISCKEQEEKQR